MNEKIIGAKEQFAIEYVFFDDTQETELSVFVYGVNILAFERNCEKLTTRWKLEELVLWLRKFITDLREDPYPVNVDGQYAAMKDKNAREFDSDDDNEFDAYYDKIDDWNLRHRWHPASSGAILADVYFQKVGYNVEISWNNEDADDGVIFENMFGGCVVSEDVFVSVIDRFLKEYADHWYRAE